MTNASPQSIFRFVGFVLKGRGDAQVPCGPAGYRFPNRYLTQEMKNYVDSLILYIFRLYLNR